MINKVILGLLSKKDLTVYDIKIAMDNSISNFYSNSFGSINPAIKKLEQQEFISCKELIEKSRLKKLYSITKQGLESYTNWISEPIKQGRIKDEVLIRIFFLGDANKDEQERLLKEYLIVLNASKEELESKKEKIEEMNLSTEKRNEIRFQLSTLQFGVDYIEFKQKWFKNLLKNL